MRRVLQALLLMTLVVVAILAKTFDSLVTAQAGENKPIGTAVVHFEGAVTHVNDTDRTLRVSGTAELSNFGQQSNSWQAIALLPFRRTANGAIQLAQQGQIRIRITRPGGHSFTLIAHSVDIRAALSIRDSVHWVILDGETDVYTSDMTLNDFENTAIASLETEFQLTFQGTADTLGTLFPITNTPDHGGPDGPGMPTSLPTVASPGL